MKIRTQTGLHKTFVREEVQDSGLHLQSSGRTHDTLEEQCVVERCEDPPKHESTIKSECRRKSKSRSVVCFGSESWSWIKAILDKGCETEAMRRVFRFKRKEDETLTGLLYGDGEGSKNDLRSDNRDTLFLDRTRHAWQNTQGL